MKNKKNIVLIIFIILISYGLNNYNNQKNKLREVEIKNEQIKKELNNLQKIEEKNTKNIAMKKENILELENKITFLKDEVKLTEIGIKDTLKEIDKAENLIKTMEEELNKKYKNRRVKIINYNNKKKIVYLTFDDGPSGNTLKVLDILKKHKVKATFFVCGGNGNTYKRIVDEGHSIGNHSYSHNYNDYVSIETFYNDFLILEKKIKKYVGYAPKIMRFPGGSNNSQAKKIANDPYIMQKTADFFRDKDYIHFDWNVSSLDATGKKITANEISKAVINQVSNKNHSIVLMHDSWTKDETVKSLNDIILTLKNKGYKFEKLTPESYSVQFY